MRTRRRRVIVIGMALVLVVATSVCLLRRSPPKYVMLMYKGMTAEQWFFGRTGHPRQQLMSDRMTAFAALGTNGIPFLLDKVRTRETAFNRFYCRIYPKLPRMLKERLEAPQAAGDIQLDAILLLKSYMSGCSDDVLCRWADPIVKSLKFIEDDGVRWDAQRELEVMPRRLDDVAESGGGHMVEYYSTFLKDPAFSIQLYGAILLSSLDPKNTNGVDILVKAVTNRTLLAKSEADLGRTSMARIKFTSSQILGLQNSVYQTLKSIAPSLAKKYAVKN